MSYRSVIKDMWKSSSKMDANALYSVSSGFAKLSFMLGKDAVKMMPFPHLSSSERDSKFMKRGKVRSILNPDNRGLLIDGINGWLSDENSFSHLALISPSGQGKTTRYIIPNVFTLKNASMIITDPSGEIYKNTSGHLKDNGFLLHVLNPSKPEQSVKYNPLERVNSYQDATEIAHILIKSANPEYQKGGKDAFWNKGAEGIISVCIQTLREMVNQNPANRKYMNLHNVLELLQSWGNDGSALDPFIRRHASPEVYRQFKGFTTGNERVAQSHISVAIASLRDLNDPNVARMMATDELDFKSFRKRKTAVFLTIPSGKFAEYSFFLSLFYTQLFRTLMEELPDKKTDFPIYCLMDEAGHYPIPQFQTTITTIRKYRVSISVVFQALAQLETLYGVAGAKTVFQGGISSRLFYAGLDVQTAKLVSEMLGKTIDPDTGKRSNLMEPDVVTRMEDDEALFIFSNKQPMHIKTRAFYADKYFNQYAQKPPVPIRAQRRNDELHYVELG